MKNIMIAASIAEVKRVVPRAVSHTEYMNMVYGNNSNYGLDFLKKLLYNNNK